MSRFPAALLAVLLGACSRPPEKADDTTAPGVLARVGSGEILAEDFAAHAADRTPPGTLADRSALLDEMIGEEALAQRARAAGLDQTPAFRRALRDFLTTRLREVELLPLLQKASILSDAELEDAVREAAPRLGQPAARRLAWIRVPFENDSETARAAATARLNEAAEKWSQLPPDPARRGFGPVAAEFSDDPDTRFQGGDLGWLSEGSHSTRLPAAACAAAAALQAPGSVTAPVILDDSVCLVLLQEQRDAQPADPAQIRERVRQDLIARRRAEAEVAWRKTHLDGTQVSIDRQALQSLSLTEAPTPDNAPPDPGGALRGDQRPP